MIKELRSVDDPLPWMEIQRRYFPNRSTESVKFQCRKRFPELIGKVKRGKKSTKTIVVKEMPENDELDGNRFVEMVEDGTTALGAAMARFVERHGVPA